MKRVLFYTLIMIAFNLTILIIPLLAFLISLSLPGLAIFNTFRWIYFPIFLFSPILLLTLCYRIGCLMNQKVWVALIPAFIGSSPIWLAYLSFVTPWNLKDLGVVLFCPIVLGLIAIGLAKITPRQAHFK